MYVHVNGRLHWPRLGMCTAMPGATATLTAPIPLPPLPPPAPLLPSLPRCLPACPPPLQVKALLVVLGVLSLGGLLEEVLQVGRVRV